MTEQPHANESGSRGWAGSLRDAIRGIGSLLGGERNARIHSIATAAVVIAGILARLDASEWRWLICAMALVWIAEALNTALEVLADAACPSHHPLVRRSKDIGAGAVLLASVAAAAIGVLVFVPLVLDTL